MVVILVLVCTSFGQKSNHIRVAVSSYQPYRCCTVFIRFVQVLDSNFFVPDIPARVLVDEAICICSKYRSFNTVVFVFVGASKFNQEANYFELTIFCCMMNWYLYVFVARCIFHLCEPLLQAVTANIARCQMRLRSGWGGCPNRSSHVRILRASLGPAALQAMPAAIENHLLDKLPAVYIHLQGLAASRRKNCNNTRCTGQRSQGKLFASNLSAIFQK